MEQISVVDEERETRLERRKKISQEVRNLEDRGQRSNVIQLVLMNLSRHQPSTYVGLGLLYWRSPGLY